MKKNILVKLIGIMFILISFAPLLQTKNFQLGFELLWFTLGMTWLNCGFFIKKKSVYRTFDRPLYILQILYLTSVLYTILIKPDSWNKAYFFFDLKIEQSKLIIIAVVLSTLSLISHFSTKRCKSTDNPARH